MAKELPYFQFEPAEYLTKDISFCSLEAQGLFINICSYYWQRECKLTTEQLLRRLNHPKELEELIGEKVISVIESVIKVSFLDDQYKNATKKSNTNSINGSKGGRPKKIKPELNPIKSETKPKLNPIKSESKGIREDKRIEEEKRVDNTFKEKKEKFIVWFNQEKKVKTGRKGTIRVMSKTDDNNLKQLFKGYKLADFQIALDNMFKSSWAVENGMCNITHLVRVDNFNKYLGQGVKQSVKPVENLYD